MTTGTATTTLSDVMLSDLWGDARSARKARLAVGALVVSAVAIGMTAPAMDASGIAFVLGLAVAILGWLAWTLLPPRLETTVVALAAISLGGSVVVAAGGRGAAAAAAFPLIAVAAATERLPLPLAFLVAATAFAIAARRCAHRWVIPDACARVRCPSGRADRRAGSASACRPSRAGRAAACGVAACNGRAGTRSRSRRAAADRTRGSRRPRALARSSLDIA